MVTIIGHRGAAGITLENTVESIKTGLALGVDAIEIDIRKTKDNKLVLSHDPHLKRVSTSAAVVADSTLEELQAIPLKDGQHIPTLAEALAAVGSTTLIIEVKVAGCMELVLEAIDTYPNSNPIVASFLHSEIGVLSSLRPSVKSYLAERQNPIAIIQSIKAQGASGMDLLYYLLNPYTYLMARRKNIDIMLYTVDSPIIARLLTWVYPHIAICTNRPDRLCKALKKSLPLKPQQ